MEAGTETGELVGAGAASVGFGLDSWSEEVMRSGTEVPGPDADASADGDDGDGGAIMHGEFVMTGTASEFLLDDGPSVAVGRVSSC